MNKNRYQKLMNEIHTPAGLNDRVLFAARQQAAEETAEKAGPKHLAPRRRHPAFLRTAACAACALALVLGSVTLRPAENGAVRPDGTPMLVPQYSFGLTAYAADIGETYTPGANGGLAFTAGEAGMADPKNGDYTGCLFQVTGKGIETVSLSIDRGGLYRYELHTGMTEEEIAAARKAMDEGTMMTTSISQRDDGVWYMPEMTVLGTSATEKFDPAVQYGFWVPPEEMVLDETMDMREAAWADIDRFDGASLTVRVQFEDGSEQSKSYQLSTGRLKVVYEDDGTRTILPQLAGDDGICVYGILAEPVKNGGAPEAAPARRFELLPYGGDREKAQENADRGRVFFSNGNWAGGSEDGKKLSQIFRIQGEGIKTVSASMNKGAFWRGYIYAAEDEKSVPNEITLSRKLFGVDPEGCGVQGRYLTLEWNVENGFTEDYDPRFCYGLRILPEEVEAMEAAEEYQSPFTFFDGAVLSITVTFDDGTAETQNYCLRADLFQGTRDEETGLYVDLTEELDPEQADNWFKGIQAKRLEWPVQGSETLRLSAPYGKSSNGTVHNGLDIPAAQGTPVLAAADGTVCETGFDPERGKYLVLDHGNGLRTVYGHCRSVDVERGDTVRAGEMVASVGATGLATGPHLHFEVHLDGETQDPVPCFAGSVQDTLKVK